MRVFNINGYYVPVGMTYDVETLDLSGSWITVGYLDSNAAYGWNMCMFLRVS
jgi:hypothetical protein